MKKILPPAAAFGLALSAVSAFAADLPSRKAAPYIPPPPPMWTGFYVGLNAGGAFDAGSGVNTIAAPIYIAPGIRTASGFAAAAAATSNLSPSNSGFIGGGQVGYNWQFGAGGLGGFGGNAFVVGVEADIQGVAGGSNAANGGAAALTGSGGNFWFGSTQVTKSVDYLGTVRGRLGYLVTPSLLVYGTGGLAYGGVTSSASIFEGGVRNGGNLFVPPPVFMGAGSFTDTRVGWTAGGGAEWMFMPNWSAKLEYLYYDLGAVNNNFVMLRPANGFANGIGGLQAAQSTTRYNGHIVRVGVNYHFNWAAPAPVLAKF